MKLQCNIRKKLWCPFINTSLSERKMWSLVGRDQITTKLTFLMFLLLNKVLTKDGMKSWQTNPGILISVMGTACTSPEHSHIEMFGF
jgi:hypothetical protein